MAASSEVQKLKGTWEYVDGEHFDDYMKEIVSGFTFEFVKLFSIFHRVSVSLSVNQLN